MSKTITHYGLRLIVCQRTLANQLQALKWHVRSNAQLLIQCVGDHFDARIQALEMVG